MKIYIDESIHNEYGFMILAFVICLSNPQNDLTCILESFGNYEFHACNKMKDNENSQKLRSSIRNYINSKCRWGVLVLPSELRYKLAQDLESLITSLSQSFVQQEVEVFIDEGIVRDQEVERLTRLDKISLVKNCDSVKEKGIQLADLVAALSGVRLREEISGNRKILEYGSESGFDPPIKADLGYELWASLRYSMYKSEKPKDTESMVFNTAEYGCFISKSCSNELKSKSNKGSSKNNLVISSGEIMYNSTLGLHHGDEYSDSRCLPWMLLNLFGIACRPLELRFEVRFWSLC